MLKKIISFALIVTVCLSLMTSCANSTENEEEALPHVHADELIDANPEWKDQLISTLSKLQADGNFDEYPGDGYAMGLFDLNYDAVPELIEVAAGGSSGAANYIAYDMKSGEVVAEFGGGVFHNNHSDVWCVYRDVATNEFKIIGNSTTHGGTTILNRHIAELVWDRNSNQYVEKSLFYINYTIEETMSDNGELIENLVIAQHYVCEKKVSVMEYNDQYDLFQSSYVRIHDTGMKLIRWADLEDPNDVHSMVDALLECGQKFINR